MNTENSSGAPSADDHDTKDCTRLPVVGTPAAKWIADGEPDPHGDRYSCERSALSMGDLTDDELANGAFMNYDAPLNLEGILAGTHSAPIAWMTAVKDRIRWLSRSLTDAQALIAELRAENERLGNELCETELGTLKFMHQCNAHVDLYRELREERDSLRAQLQAAPAERQIVMPEPMKRSDAGGMGEYGAAMIRGYNACLREVGRLNQAPADHIPDATKMVEAVVSQEVTTDAQPVSDERGGHD